MGRLLSGEAFPEKKIDCMYQRSQSSTMRIGIVYRFVFTQQWEPIYTI